MGRKSRPRVRRAHEPPVQPVSRPSWYALARGGWRDYVTLLHPPYTAWHLSYVVIGGCLASVVSWQRLGAAVTAFALAVGVGAHALDELNGRPLQTKIPDGVLATLAGVSIVGACAIGIAGWSPRARLALLIPVGLFLVLAYNLARWQALPFGHLVRACLGRVPRRQRLRRSRGNVRAIAVLTAARSGASLVAGAVDPRPVRATPGRRGPRRSGSPPRAPEPLMPAAHRRRRVGLRLLPVAMVVLAATLVAYRL
jgi:hypothetical protein